MSDTIPFHINVDLHEKVKAEASRQNVSVDRLIINAVELYLETEKERVWRVGFEAMGRDPDTNNVDYLLSAGREVVFHDIRSE
ncbi:hypothetical protein CCAX7_003970 [Capsulimonas corticalis]|uniref:Uncharacterized protein n=1 Tax=Capsulimonas corticalis TaxID=2219043 RepID=A0A402D339_9BACT|nr:hypothetical protein [Capsulimonas corticalis]BDI28346.1 hypothetical protein CCAX7_003970 [Capsulimonas corticalis]